MFLIVGHKDLTSGAVIVPAGYGLYPVSDLRYVFDPKVVNMDNMDLALWEVKLTGESKLKGTNGAFTCSFYTLISRFDITMETFLYLESENPGIYDASLNFTL